ncbi:MAG: hypothetical protein P4L43_11085 [Syntrophobacteraceae bacterium]|nr:hypothetical protein [Syntrophobacteraceae bacterium]
MDRGVYYLYLIIGLQVLFVLGLMGIIMFIGKVISTPAWVFLFIFGVSLAGIAYVYRKAKNRFRRFSESFGRTDRNYEISFMGGMLTMKIEQNLSSANLLAAPAAVSDDQIIDAETSSGPGPAPKSVQPH